MARRLLNGWHVVFGALALYFAAQYLRDAFAEEGATSSMIKGGAWVALALVPIVIGFMRSRRRNSDG